jgi:Transmembrane secretion effector
VPEVLPEDVLPQANSLDQLVRPIALRLAGPALGGLLVDAIGTSGAFTLDVASFLLSAAALRAMSGTPRTQSSATGSVGREIAAGLLYLRRHA